VRWQVSHLHSLSPSVVLVGSAFAKVTRFSTSITTIEPMSEAVVGVMVLVFEVYYADIIL
jgi:hypothetical protein